MKMVQEQAKSATPGKGTVTVEQDVKFTKLTETDDVEAYLMMFKRTMNAFKVPQEQWVYKLAPQLTGRAQQAFAAMETVGASNYDEVKAAILLRYNINKETYRQRLRSIRPKEEETHRELAVRVLDLTRKWSKECKKPDDFMELIATEQLLEALPTGVRIWVRERKPKTATEAGQLADDYVQARRQEKNVPGASTGGEGSSPRQCGYCGRIGHSTEECRHLKKREEMGSSRPAPRRVCFKCGEEGHIKVNCPKKVLYSSIQSRTRGAVNARVYRRGW